MQVQQELEKFAKGDGLSLPLPGSGETWKRFEKLASLAAQDLSLGRLAEGHSDALAILAEAGMKPLDEAALYGVWASRSRNGDTSAQRVAGGWRLSGVKEFCSGSGIIDRSLVSADTPEGYRMFDIALKDQVVGVRKNSWPAVGMASSLSETLIFGGPIVAVDREVDGPDFYTKRPGFWFGAAGVAACWYGGARALVASLFESQVPTPSDHVLADVGRAVAEVEMMRSVLRDVAYSIDADPADSERRAHFRALVSRQVVHDASLRVLTLVASAGGARPLCHDEEQSRRSADLFVYLAQHHGGADAAELGRLASEARPWN